MIGAEMPCDQHRQRQPGKPAQADSGADGGNGARVRLGWDSFGHEAAPSAKLVKKAIGADTQTRTATQTINAAAGTSMACASSVPAIRLIDSQTMVRR